MSATMASRLVIFTCVFGLLHASAIPMWEYLTKDEKMAYLYNMFANQVDDYCNSANMKDCNVELLRHGLKNLHGMPEDHLDVMDPYQRGANTMIWDSMMEGHQMMQNKKPSTPKPKGRDVYDEYQDSNYLGSASNKHETIVTPQKTRVFTTTAPFAGTTNNIKKYYGPMIVKLHPDGRPVQEEKEIPHDDDHHHYIMIRKKVPALNTFGNNPYTVFVHTRRS